MPIQKLCVAMLGLTLLCSVASAQKTTSTLVVRSPQLEKGSYLGIAASAASPAMREQLRLKPGIGLVVDRVERGSPAEEAGIKQYDVIDKLNDQWLINSEQFVVLIRMNDPGSEVKLSIIRAGQPQVVSAKLVEKEVPPLAATMNEMISNLTLTKTGSGAMNLNGGVPGGSLFTTNASGQTMRLVSTIGQSTLTLTRDAGQLHLVATGADGESVFDGNLNSDQDLKQLPPELEKRVRQLLTMTKATLPTTMPPPYPAEK